MSVIGSNILAGASGQGGVYNLTKSLRFRSSASASLSRTPASATNRTTWTWSNWVKRGALGSINIVFEAGSSGTNDTTIYFNTSNQLEFFNRISSSVTGYLVTTQVFRDPSAWYHIVAVWDSGNGTASSRMKLYINGVQVTAFATQTNPSSSENSSVNNTVLHKIGATGAPTPSSGYFDGYLAEVNFIDGQALTPSSFGETSTSTGVWIPKKYTGTYGTNGFYLPFTDTTSTSTLGTDFSGNSNTWTVNNISLTSGSTYDSMNDVPTLTSATASNYCVLNPLIPITTTTVTNGNLGLNAYNPAGSVFGTIGVSSGKWYFESIAQTDAVSGISGTLNGGAFPGAPANGYAWDSAGADKYNNNTGSAYGSATSNGDIVGVAFDLDTGSITFYKNGVSQGVAYTFTPSGSYFPAFRNGDPGAGGGNISVNFGQRPFAYTPPTGFVALNTFNLPTPTIGATASTQANDYFNIALYTGTGSSLSVTGVGFQPDWTWIKSSSAVADHGLYDAVRGVQKQLESNTTSAETTETTGLTAFGSDGFTVGALAQLNTSSATYIGWNWKANGAGSSNTQGSITSTVSASTTAGFSIVTYTGNGSSPVTIGHGLGVTPAMIILKDRDAISSWMVKQQNMSSNTNIFLEGTGGEVTPGNGYIQNLTSSTTFGVINGGSGVANVNTNNNKYVAYCFAPIAGYSAFGSYTGNGSTDGTFVYTGFRPRYVMIKRTDSAEQWYINDTSRDTYNVTGNSLRAQSSGAEATTGGANSSTWDILSNGFKLRDTGAGTNASGGTYIYMVFAESPFKYANAR